MDISLIAPKTVLGAYSKLTGNIYTKRKANAYSGMWQWQPVSQGSSAADQVPRPRRPQRHRRGGKGELLRTHTGLGQGVGQPRQELRRVPRGRPTHPRLCFPHRRGERRAPPLPRTPHAAPGGAEQSCRRRPAAGPSGAKHGGTLGTGRRRVPATRPSAATGRARRGWPRVRRCRQTPRRPFRAGTGEDIPRT